MVQTLTAVGHLPARPLAWPSDLDAQIKSIGVPLCHPLAKGISIVRSFCHILCHIAFFRVKSGQDGQKDTVFLHCYATLLTIVLPLPRP